MNDLANINVSRARLPQAYEAAKAALANCASIDECQEWADKAAALASYARQADDDALQKHCLRIQARAVRRCGELLKQFDGRGRPQENKVATDPDLSQRAAGEAAGMSPRQVKTAVRVAKVPVEAFDTAVDSEAPPTVTALAEAGRQPRAPSPSPSQSAADEWLKSEKPQGFLEATFALGTVDDFAKFCAAHDAEFVAGGVLPHEVAAARRRVTVIDGWLDRFIVNLKG